MILLMKKLMIYASELTRKVRKGMVSNHPLLRLIDIMFDLMLESFSA